MPVVNVQLWPGRTVEQKRNLVNAITDAMVEHADAKPTNLHVIIQEIPLENWGLAGVLGVDRKDDHARDLQQNPPQPEPEPGAIAVHHLLLQVRDLERAKRFYLDLLGFTLRPDAKPMPDGRLLISTVQGLGLTEGDPGEQGQMDHLAFEVRQVTTLTDKLKQAGVEFVRELGPGPYGLAIYVKDPDGNTLELFETGAQA
jgi:4-oxalocrotonate tautomerase